MKFIETEYFNQQLNSLKNTYINVKSDYEDFKIDFKTDFSVHLG